MAIKVANHVSTGLLVKPETEGEREEESSSAS